jgi:hypothetical protein
MCHYITGTISGEVTVQELNSVGQEFGLQFETCPNEFVQKQLKSGESYIWKRCKYCDCGTPLGTLNAKNIKRTKGISEAEIEKLKRKGWSEAKIQRFLNDKNKKEEQNDKDLEQMKLSAENGVQEWIDFCKKLFETVPIDTFGILLHWYERGISNERITLNGRTLIDRSELAAKKMLEIEEDMLYIIS